MQGPTSNPGAMTPKPVNGWTQIPLTLAFTCRLESRFQSRSMLVQIRFFTDPLDQVQTFIGIETAGFNHQGEAWRLSTIAQWQLVGDYQPAKDVCDRLQRFSQKAFELFASGNSDAVT